jgi:flavin reductase (DIM6/NTAB) family NADH-FMN oxidoreductase RutF
VASPAVATDLARYAAAPFRLHHGVPVLDGGLTWVTCGVAETCPGGDHTIVLGAVTGTSLSHGEPLVRHSGRYRRLVPARQLRSYRRVRSTMPRFACSPSSASSPVTRSPRSSNGTR